MIYRGEIEPTKVLASIEVDTSEEISIEELRRMFNELREAIQFYYLKREKENGQNEKNDSQTDKEN